MDVTRFFSQHLFLILALVCTLVRLSEQSIAGLGLVPPQSPQLPPQLLPVERRRREAVGEGDEMATEWTDEEQCPIFQNEPLHAIMDRVCEMCHEMFSHKENSLRSECRKNCFRNDKFKMCIGIFSPQGGRARRSA